MENQMKQMKFRLDKQIEKELKIYLIKNELTLQDFLESYIRETLKKDEDGSE